MRVKSQAQQKIASKFESKYDIDGSYTGKAYKSEYEKPVQDVDDL